MPILGVIASSKLTAAAEGAELISTQDVSGVGTINFNNLNTYSQYKHLEFRMNLVTNAGLYMRMRFNSDSGSNYTSKGFISLNTTNGNDDYPSGYLTSGALPRVADQSPSQYASITLIPYFNDTSGRKGYISYGGGGSYTGANVQYFEQLAGQWFSSSAITSVTLFMNANTWNTGSRISLYGWR